MSRITYALIAVNVIVYAWMLARGVDFMSPDVDDLLAFGADSPARVTLGEPWRLFTCMFVHAGIVHLGCNMWALRSLGPPVEMLFGRARFALMYVLAGLGGSVASCLWNPAGVSVGASGAIFGLPGALMAFFVMHRSQLPPGLFSAQMRWMGTFLAINVLIALSIPQIDLAGHVGGLVTGFACGLAGYRSRASTAAITRPQVVKFAAIAVVLAASIPAIHARVSHDERAQEQYWIIRGESALKSKDLRSTRSISDSIVEALPNWAYGYELRARVLVLTADHEGALRELDRALELDPDADIALRLRAWLRTESGDHPGALADLRRLIGLGGLETPGEWKAALTVFEREIAEHGAADREAQLYAWSCRVRLGMRDSAMQALRAALDAGELGSGFERAVGEYLVGAISDVEFEQRARNAGLADKVQFWTHEKSAALATKAVAR